MGGLAQTERISLFTEECGEALSIVGKIQRHGWQSHDPTAERPDWNPPSNKQLLEREVGDVLAAIELMTAAGDIDPAEVERAVGLKLARVRQWLHCPENIRLATERGGA